MKTVNENGLAIYSVLKSATSVLSFAEIADLAKVEPKTGYLTSARSLAKADKLAIVKREKAVKVSVTSVTVYPSGLRVEATKETLVDGYELVALD